MAVTLNNSSNSGAQAGQTTFSFSHTINAGSNQLLAVLLSSGSSPIRTVVSVTWNTVETLTAVPSAHSIDGHNFWFSDIYYLKAPSSGSHSVTVILSNAADSVVGALSFDGVDQTTPVGTVATAHNNAGETDQPSISVGCATGDIVVDVVAHDTVSTDGITMTAGTGRTQKWNINAAVNSGDGGGAITDGAGSSVTTAWTVADSSSQRDWAISGVAIKASTGGAAAVHNLTLLGVGGRVPIWERDGAVLRPRRRQILIPRLPWARVKQLMETR